MKHLKKFNEEFDGVNEKNNSNKELILKLTTKLGDVLNFKDKKEIISYGRKLDPNTDYKEMFAQVVKNGNLCKFRIISNKDEGVQRWDNFEEINLNFGFNKPSDWRICDRDWQKIVKWLKEN